MAQAFAGTRACYSAVHIGNCLYVAAEDKSCQHVTYRYDLNDNSWETLPHFQSSKHQINCLCAVDECIFAFSDSNLPQRYSLLKNNMQCGANLSFYNTSNSKTDKLQNVGAVVSFKSKIYVIHGYTRSEHDNGNHNYRVDMAAEQKTSTWYPHFGSSLFVVNNRLCAAWRGRFLLVITIQPQ